MHRTTKTTLASLMVGAALAAAPGLYAQATQATQPADRHMMGGDMAGMRKMMGDMHAMTEACNTMMQSMHPHSGDQPHHNPPADSDRRG